MKSGPRLPQLEKALAQKRRPNIVINQSINQSIFEKLNTFKKKKGRKTEDLMKSKQKNNNNNKR